MLKPCIIVESLNSFNKENRVSKADRSHLFFMLWQQIIDWPSVKKNKLTWEESTYNSVTEGTMKHGIEKLIVSPWNPSKSAL